MKKKLLRIAKIAVLLKRASMHLNNERYRSQMMIAQIEDLHEDCDKISCPYLIYFPRNNPSKSVTFRPVHHFK